MKNRDIARRKCGKCDRIFSKVEHLRRHERSHTGERPFKCSSCGRTYARSDVLSRHIRNNHCPTESVYLNTGSADPCQSPEAENNTGQNESPPLLVSPDQEMGIESTLEEPWPTAATGGNILRTSPHVPSLEDSHTEWPGSLMPTVNQPSKETCISHEAAGEWETPEQTSQLLLNGHQTRSSIQDALLPSIQSSTLHDELDILAHHVDFEGFTFDGLLMTPPSGSEPHVVVNDKNGISNEQFEQVRRLWPTRRRKANVSPFRFACDEVIHHSKHGLFSSTFTRATGENNTATEVDSMWGFTSQCRDQLVQMMQLYEQSSTSLARDVTIDSPDSRRSWADELPPTDILELCLDLYFSHTQTLLPFIHPPTFKACETPSILVFPMCLTGYMILDRNRASKLIHTCLPAAIRQCKAEIGSQYLRTCPAPDLLIVLAAAILLLNIAACTSDLALEEQRQELYEKSLLLARERGLFDHRLYDLSSKQGLGDDTIWSAWARVQSAERLIGALVITDSYSAQVLGLGLSPMLRPEETELPVLCPDVLFSYHSVVKWRAFIDSSGDLTLLQSVPYNIQSPPNGLSGFGLQIFLSCIWLDILTSRHRISAPVRCSLQNQAPSPSLTQILAADARYQSLAPGLVHVFKAYGPELTNGNANSVILWHLLCLNMTTNLPTIEDAAGRNGPEAANAAVESLRIWADSPHGRRAFLHSAQNYLLITQHRKSDGIMLHSEMAFFTAALVMGFYLLTAPTFKSSDRASLDVFDELDWEKVGSEGIDYASESSFLFSSSPAVLAAASQFTTPPVPPGHPRASTSSIPSVPAVEFIRHGGNVSFRQAQYTSYGATRRSFMNFAAQLEDVGKWNSHEYCKVLRILSDTLPGCCESRSDIDRVSDGQSVSS